LDTTNDPLQESSAKVAAAAGISTVSTDRRFSLQLLRIWSFLQKKC